jgi:hypothetical protein
MDETSEIGEIGDVGRVRSKDPESSDKSLTTLFHEAIFVLKFIKSFF